MSTIILTTGLPGSGKSTWAKQHAKQSNGDIVLTSRDDIRLMLGIGPIGNKDQEALVSKVQDDIIVRVINEGKGLIVHDTNLNARPATRIKKLFDGEVKFAVADFTEVPIEVCIERDAQRPNPVGEPVIRNMAKQLQKQWRLTPEWLNDKTLSAPIVYDPKLPWCVVFDTDGTTAHHNRSPYDYPKCYSDTVDLNIKMLLKIIYAQGEYDNITLIGMSGRPDTWRDMTEQWYRDNGIWYDDFYMRPAGDGRPDTVIKQEMYDKYIRGKYNVLIHLDDRDSVVRAIRKLGVKVAQVAPGDF